MTSLRQDVDEQGQRLDEVEGTVDETVEKVTEIDKKVREKIPQNKRKNRIGKDKHIQRQYFKLSV